MRALIQRVKHCEVFIKGKEHSRIQNGLLVLLGIGKMEAPNEIEKLSHKITALRIFSDKEGKMNLSVKDIEGEIMVVSQFTLWADTKKGNRPSFITAARPEEAIPIYEEFIRQITLDLGKEVSTGIFGADMQIELENDGPVTIWIDTENWR